MNLPRLPLPSLKDGINADFRAKAERFEAISGVDQYDTYVATFTQKYDLYALLDSRLSENEKLFNELGAVYERIVQTEKEIAEDDALNMRELKNYKAQTSNTISELYKARYSEVDELNSLYCNLHTELTELKEMITAFVNQKTEELKQQGVFKQ